MAVVDRGYAWVVLAAACILQLFGFGASIGGVGVMLISFSKAFPQADRAQISWIGSLRAFQQLASPIAVLLIKRFGCRVVTIAGALVAAAGIAVSSVSTDVWHAYLSYSVLGGIGVALTYTCSTAVLGEYFDKRKNIAFPVACLGNSLGLLIFPYVLRLILDSVGHANTLYITAALKAVEIACGFVFKPNKADAEPSKGVESAPPSPPPPQEEADRKERSADGRTSVYVIGDAAKPRYQAEVSLIESDSPIKLRETTPLTGRRESDGLPTLPPATEAAAAAAVGTAERTRSGDVGAAAGVVGGAHRPTGADDDSGATMVQVARRNAVLRMLDLLRDWQCWALLVHSFCWGFTVVSTEVLAPISVQSRGVSDTDASLGLTIFGAGMLLSSLVMLGLGSRRYDRFALYMPICGILGVAAILLSVSDLAVAYFIICSLYGFLFGILISLFLSVVSDFKSAEHYADLFGLYILFNGVGALVGPIALGALQTSVSDKASWYLCGAVGILGTAVLIPPLVIRRRPPRR